MPPGLGDTVLSQVALLASGIGVVLATAVLLGPAGRGEVVFVVAASTLAGGAASGSVYVGATVAVRRGDPGAVRRALGLAVWLAAAVVVLLLVVAGLLAAAGASQAPGVALAAIGAGLFSLNITVVRLRSGLGDTRGYRRSSTVQAGLYAVLAVCAAAIAREPLPVVLAWYAALLASAVVGLRGLDLGPRAARMPRWVLLRPSLAAHVGWVGTQAMCRADLVVLAFVVPAADLGVYSVAAPVAELPWLLAESLALLAFSRSSVRGGRPEELSRRRLMRFHAVVGTAGGVLVAALALGIGRVLPEYAAAAVLVWVLLPGVVVHGLSRIVTLDLAGRGASRQLVTIGLVSLALSASYVPFAIGFGVTGAAVAATLMYVAQALVVWQVARRFDRRPGADQGERPATAPDAGRRAAAGRTVAAGRRVAAGPAPR